MQSAKFSPSQLAAQNAAPNAIQSESASTNKAKASSQRRRRREARPAWVARATGLLDVLWTQDPVLRVCLQQTTLSLLMAVCCVAIGVFGALWAGTPAAIAWTWGASSFLVGGMVYGLIRSGVTRDWADPALTMLQMMSALTASAMAYAMLGPVRALTLPVLIVALMFGLFTMPPKRLAGIAAYGVLAFGLAMMGMALARPDVYPPVVESLHFAMLLVTMPAVPLLGLRYAAVRERFKQQQDEFQRVRQLATRDELTGLLNRRQMTDMLERSEQFKRRTGRPFCIAVVDLDHFKRINDVHGHEGGDEVLRRFAQLAKATVRDNDAVARWGGEEFVILMGDTKIEAGLACVERVRARMAQEPIEMGSSSLQVTLSAGIAEPMDGEGYERALSRADHALYAAKARGRNRVLAA
jgi:diguanylate cyclase